MRIVVLVLTLGLMAGCSKAPDARTDGGNVKEGEEIAKNPLAAANQAVQLAQKMEAINKEAEAMKPVDPVHFEKLLPLLPAAPAGYKADDAPEGRTDELGAFKHSYVQANYRADDKSLSIKIHDTAQVADFYRAFASAALVKSESTEGYQKGVTIDGDPGFENYRKATKAGDLTVMLGKRFLVEVRGDGIDPDFLRTVYNSIDRKKLLALK